jgi:hypothetical protein
MTNINFTRSLIGTQYEVRGFALNLVQAADSISSAGWRAHQLPRYPEGDHAARRRLVRLRRPGVRERRGGSRRLYLRGH